MERQLHLMVACALKVCLIADSVVFNDQSVDKNICYEVV